MKKIILPIVVSVSSMALHVHAQVGVNTDKPASTFDITAKNATGTTKNVDGLLIPRVDRERAQNMSSVPTSTLIYINSAATGSQTGTAINIDAVGYYYFNGTAWTKLTSTGSNNIYNTDGTLTGNRIVTQGTNTLAFNGSAVNAFSVDGTTFSVDAANDRVGIGTNNPQAQLHLGQTLGNRKIVMHDGYSDDNTFYGFGVNPFTLRYQVPIIGAAHVFFAGNGSNSNELFRINGNGNVGIGTSTPQKMFHVTGASQFGNEINVGGTATTTGSPGTAGQVLTSAGAGAAPTWTTPAVAASTNIYNTDGALTGNRTVAQGINTLAFTGAGNMGIGTATPQKRLHVDGDLQITKELNVGGSGTAAGSAGTAGQILTSSGAGAAPTWATPAAVTSTNIYNADGTLTGNRTVTQGANTLVFTGTGNVGIGTSSPTNKLVISGKNSQPVAGAASDAPLRIDGGMDHAMEMGTFTNSPWGAFINAVQPSSRNGRPLTLNSIGGNVGIGTNDPQKTLHVNGSAQFTNEINVGGTANTAGSAGTAGQILTSAGAGTAPTWTTLPVAVDTNTNIYNTDGTLGTNRIVTQADKTLSFTTDNTKVNAFSVDSGTLSVDALNNRVGIGNTAPHGQLQLGNSIINRKIVLYENTDNDNQFFGFGVNQFLLRYQSEGTGSDHGFFAATGANTSQELMRIKGNGNVGIGTATPQKMLHVTGTTQFGNEINVGGTATTAGSPGTAGQVLTSAGVGAAPTWTTPAVATSTNIYNADGTLTGNRTVAQGANTIAFNGTAVNAFSVDGGTLSVDAANDRVGIGKTAPQFLLDLGNQEGKKISLYNDSGSNFWGFGLGNNALDLYTANNKLMTLGTTNVGIGTSTPQKKLHVDGDLQITKELNVGGSGTVAGSAGTAGQILTSAGAGAAPTWATPAVVTSTNIYNADGTLTGNRTVAQGANTLAFTGTGNVGIGTTAPSAKLHVNGTVQFNNEIKVGGAGNAGTAGQILTSAGAGAAPTWTTPAVATSTNIYNADGTLTGNRTVTQGANTLAFNGTAVNAFSVDGTTLSVDAANNRVGIGTDKPNAPLQLANGVGNRKIVLHEIANNDNQFYGFGINDFTLRYQSQANHVFYAESGAAASSELFRVNGDGNVAVGTSTPQKKFHVNGTSQFTNEINVGGTASTAGSPGTVGQVLTSAGAGAAPTWTTPTVATSTNIYNTDGTLTGNRTVTQADKTLSFTTDNTKVNAFSVDSGTLSVDALNNRVGIGKTDPHGQLHLGNSIVSRKIVLYENGDNDNQFFGLGINSSVFRYQTAETSSDHVFFAGSGASASNELLRIKGTGNVGIGTSAPSAKLHVEGTARVTDTPVTTNASNQALVVDASGNLRTKPNNLTNSIPIGQTVSWADFTPADLTADMYLIDKTAYIDLPITNLAQFKGRIIRFYISGGIHTATQPITLALRNVSAIPSQLGTNLPEGYSYTEGGTSGNDGRVIITGLKNQYRIIEVICTGGAWMVDHRN